MNKVTDIKGNINISNVLISVSDKSNLDVLIFKLLEVNSDVVFYSTSGTYNYIKNLLTKSLRDKHLVDISDYTGFPEMQGGLVKTLHPKIHMGILAERINENHSAELLNLSAVRFDLVIVNLYPFSEVVEKENCSFEEARANIDIGGPTMIRGAVKNFHGCAVLTDPTDYYSFGVELSVSHGYISLKTRFYLMKIAFDHTSSYELIISKYFLNMDDDILSGEYAIDYT